MYNCTAVAKVFATAASTLAIALLIVGIGIDSTYAAGSHQASGLKFTPISFEGVYRSGATADKSRRFAQACMHFHEGCSIPPDMRFPCCGGAQVCKPNPKENGRYWCIGDVR